VSQWDSGLNFVNHPIDTNRNTHQKQGSNSRKPSTIIKDHRAQKKRAKCSLFIYSPYNTSLIKPR